MLQRHWTYKRGSFCVALTPKIVGIIVVAPKLWPRGSVVGAGVTISGQLQADDLLNCRAEQI
jgi:hypothetical protein